MEKGFRTHEGLTAHFSRFFLGFKKGVPRGVYKCYCRSVFFISTVLYRTESETNK